MIDGVLSRGENSNISGSIVSYVGVLINGSGIGAANDEGEDVTIDSAVDGGSCTRNSISATLCGSLFRTETKPTENTTTIQAYKIMVFTKLSWLTTPSSIDVSGVGNVNGVAILLLSIWGVYFSGFGTVILRSCSNTNRILNCIISSIYDIDKVIFIKAMEIVFWKSIGVIISYLYICIIVCKCSQVIRKQNCLFVFVLLG